MKFDTGNPKEAQAATDYLAHLIETKKIVEVKRISPKRSLNQNNYLHLLLGYFGQHFGYTLEEAKIIYKRNVNPLIYAYEKNSELFLRSSADLDTAEMTMSIDHFRVYSDEVGLPLPTATDQGWLREIENEIERNRYHL